MASVRQLHNWVRGPVHSTLLQLPRALVVSVLALALDVSLFELCVRLVGVPVVPAAVVGYLAGSVVQYVLCSLWVFPDAPGNSAVAFVAFTLLSLVGLAITCAIVYALHDLAHANELLAKCVAVGAAFVWNFLSRKLLLFRPSPADSTLERTPAGASA
jgi:putative flippase GtrA